MDMLDQILSVTPHVGLVLCLNVLGYWLKRSPVKDWLIPFILLPLAAIAWPIIADVKNDDYTAQLVTRNVIVGILLGAASIGLHQIVRKIFPFLFPERGDTMIIKKDDVEPPNKEE